MSTQTRNQHLDFFDKSSSQEVKKLFVSTFVITLETNVHKTRRTGYYLQIVEKRL